MRDRASRKRCIWMFLILGGIWTLTHLSACNTTEGIGEDIEEVGEELQDAAD